MRGKAKKSEEVPVKMKKAVKAAEEFIDSTKTEKKKKKRKTKINIVRKTEPVNPYKVKMPDVQFLDLPTETAAEAATERVRKYQYNNKLYVSTIGDLGKLDRSEKIDYISVGDLVEYVPKYRRKTRKTPKRKKPKRSCVEWGPPK